MHTSNFDENSYYTGEMGDRRQRNGHGIQYWSDGSIYDGHWVDDLVDGIGRYKDSDGNVYEGGWRRGQKHGEGRQTYKATQSTIVGIWNGDEDTIWGVENTHDGEEYRGEFFHD
jgi:hypothetical protein